MNEYFNKFLYYLDKEDKESAVNYVLNLLNHEQITLQYLYDYMLAPSLINFPCGVDDKEICIWKEHTRTSIIKTILECTFPYLIKQDKIIKPNNLKILVVCPSEEQHEIGAMMVCNYFIMAGFSSHYIGSNTPKDDILSAVKILKPNFLAISVSNYYNLIITKQIIDEIKEKYPNVKIIVGGQAFEQIDELHNFHYDYHLKNFDQIIDFTKAVSL